MQCIVSDSSSCTTLCISLSYFITVGSPAGALHIQLLKFFYLSTIMHPARPRSQVPRDPYHFSNRHKIFIPRGSVGFLPFIFFLILSSPNFLSPFFISILFFFTISCVPLLYPSSSFHICVQWCWEESPSVRVLLGYNSYVVYSLIWSKFWDIDSLRERYICNFQTANLELYSTASYICLQDRLSCQRFVKQ